MKVGSFSVFVMLLGLGRISSALTPKGNIFDHQVWTAKDSPVYITEDLYVLDHGRLTIEGGVKVKYNESASIYVRGHVNVHGSENETVVFENGYQALAMMGDSNGNVNVSYAEFFDFATGAIMMVETSNNMPPRKDLIVKVHNCKFVRNGYGIRTKALVDVFNSTFDSGTKAAMSFYFSNVSHVTVRNFTEYCIYAGATSMISNAIVSGCNVCFEGGGTIRDSQMSHCQTGITARYAGWAGQDKVIVSNVHVSNIEKDGLQIRDGTVLNSTICAVGGNGIVGASIVADSVLRDIGGDGISHPSEYGFCNVSGTVVSNVGNTGISSTASTNGSSSVVKDCNVGIALSRKSPTSNSVSCSLVAANKIGLQMRGHSVDVKITDSNLCGNNETSFDASSAFGTSNATRVWFAKDLINALPYQPRAKGFLNVVAPMFEPNPKASMDPRCGCELSLTS